jgi:hypothetical protein
MHPNNSPSQESAQGPERLQDVNIQMTVNPLFKEFGC